MQAAADSLRGNDFFGAILSAVKGCVGRTSLSEDFCESFYDDRNAVSSGVRGRCF